MPLRNLTILLMTALVSLLCYAEAGRNRYASILSESIDKISSYYVEPVEARKLFEGGMNGMLTDLDPYSGYIRPEDFSEFQVDIQQEFGGIGVEVGLENERLTVLSPVPGTPAYEAGLRSGDTILAIDGQDTEGFSLEDAVGLMRGPRGSTVLVKVRHKGIEEPKEYPIVRERIRIESVRGERRSEDSQWIFQIEDDSRIGYIRLTGFGEHTTEDFKRSLNEMQGEIEGLIIDLRGNAGGLLTSAVEICDMFIDEGEVIVSTRGRDPTEERVVVAEEPPLVDPDLPVVVLVDPLSASASEILAACLQDYGRATIVGERSWGKGTVQNVIEIEGGRSAIRLTTQTYWRPSGKNIHRHVDATDEDEWGVKPLAENEVKLTNEEREKVYRFRRLRETSGRVDGEEMTEEQIELEDYVDPQLQRAIDILKKEMPPRTTDRLMGVEIDKFARR